MSVHIHKACNAFIPNAETSELVTGEALTATNRIRKKKGGLWVGGKLLVDDDSLRFAPNTMNQAFHQDLREICIPLDAVRSVTREFGWLTGIVVVIHAEGEFRFRCFGASNVASTLTSFIALA